MKITRKILAEAVSCDDLQYNRKADSWTFRRGFFYTGRFTSDKWMEKVSRQLKDAKLGSFLVLDSGEVWKAFNGGAPTRRQSHWFVTVVFDNDVCSRCNIKICPEGGHRCGDCGRDI